MTVSSLAPRDIAPLLLDVLALVGAHGTSSATALSDYRAVAPARRTLSGSAPW